MTLREAEGLEPVSGATIAEALMALSMAGAQRGDECEDRADELLAALSTLLLGPAGSEV